MESFNGKLRDELLKRESFDTLLEAKVLVERQRQAYNTVRPHRADLLESENVPELSVPSWGAGQPSWPPCVGGARSGRGRRGRLRRGSRRAVGSRMTGGGISLSIRGAALSIHRAIAAKP